MGHTAYSIRLLGSLTGFIRPRSMTGARWLGHSGSSGGELTPSPLRPRPRHGSRYLPRNPKLAEARDVNDRGMMELRSLAWKGFRGGPSGTRRAALVWIPRSHGYRRLRLRTRPLMVVTSLGQIDGRGDVAGDERPVRGSRSPWPNTSHRVAPACYTLYASPLSAEAYRLPLDQRLIHPDGAEPNPCCGIRSDIVG